MNETSSLALVDPPTCLTESSSVSSAHSHAFTHVYASTNLSNYTSATLLLPTPFRLCPPPDTIPVMYSYFVCVFLLYSIPYSFPSFLSPFSSPLCAFVSPVRRGPVLFTSLSPQAGDGLLCLQPLPETRVQGFRSAQPSPALFFLQHWALLWLILPQHPSKYPHSLPLPWLRPRPSRYS